MDKVDNFCGRELKQEIENILDLIPQDFGGGCGFNKASLMTHLFSMFDLKTYVEIGVYRGRSFFPMAAACKYQQGRAYGIDPYDCETAKENEVAPEYQEHVNNFIDSLDFSKMYNDVENLRNQLNLGDYSMILREKSSDAVNYFRENNIIIDMLHIDGNHDTRFVMEDIELYWPLVKEGAL